MSTRRSRRTVLAAGIGLAAGLLPWQRRSHAAARARVVVVGGGFGGATAAAFLRRADPAIAVTLVTAQEHVTTCPSSNAVIAGLRPLDELTFGYDGLARRGIETVPMAAQAIDGERREVVLADGTRLPFDRAVVAPGIDLVWDAIEGYGPAAAERMPHAWQAGAQTLLLRRQIEALPEGGRVIIVAPANPYRCPPGPYERASLIAAWMARHRPRASILILDAKDSFSKQAAFLAAWAELYPGRIEWVPGARDGRVVAVDPAAMTVTTEFGTVHRGDVVNVIPPQRAGAVAAASGLADATGWCPVDQRRFLSRAVPAVHVVGDAIVSGALPKSAFCTVNQAKIAALAVAAALHEAELPDPVLLNTCYSLVAPDQAISVSGVYRPDAEGMAQAVAGAGGMTAPDAGPDIRRAEAAQAAGWYRAATADAFG